MPHATSTTAETSLNTQAFCGPAYRADIDGLRAVAVLTVLLNHIAPGLLPGGYVGVDVFFVISGYLITKIVHQEISEGRFSFTNFYTRRARRILPALFAVCVATTVVGYMVMLPSDYSATLRATIASVLSLSNFLFWKEGASYFNALEGRHNPLLHTWSLGVEEQFYLLYPALLVAWSLLAKRARMMWLVLVGFGSLFIAGMLASRYSREVFYLLPFRAWELLAGAVLALGLVPRLESERIRTLLRAAGLMAIAYACLFYTEATVFPGFAALIPVLGAAAVIHAGIGRSTTQSILSNRPMVYIGAISYSLYLWHWPVIVFAAYLGFPSDGWVAGVVLAALSLVLASLSYHFVERPFRTERLQSNRWRLGMATSLASLLLAFGVAGLMARGFSDRFAPEVVRLDAANAVESPFLHCFGRPVQSSCRLGDAAAEPDMLLWGDSHALSWAVTFDLALSEAHRSALLVSNSGCPPLIDIHNAANARCGAANASVQEFLSKTTGIRTVVLVGFWSTYFRPDGPISHIAVGSPMAKGALGAGQSMRATVGMLESKGLQSMLIGPVPAYERRVPTALALERALGRPFLDRTRQGQEKKLVLYREQIGKLQGQGLHIFEPMDWLCTHEVCQVERDGQPLYQDGHHLSPIGAQGLVHEIAAATGRGSSTVMTSTTGHAE